MATSTSVITQQANRPPNIQYLPGDVIFVSRRVGRLRNGRHERALRPLDSLVVFCHAILVLKTDSNGIITEIADVNDPAGGGDAAQPIGFDAIRDALAGTLRTYIRVIRDPAFIADEFPEGDRRIFRRLSDSQRSMSEVRQSVELWSPVIWTPGNHPAGHPDRNRVFWYDLLYDNCQNWAMAQLFGDIEFVSSETATLLSELRRGYHAFCRGVRGVRQIALAYFNNGVERCLSGGLGEMFVGGLQVIGSGLLLLLGILLVAILVVILVPTSYVRRVNMPIEKKTHANDEDDDNDDDARGGYVLGGDSHTSKRLLRHSRR